MYIYRITKVIALLCILLLSSCGAFLNQPVAVQEARIGEITPAAEKLAALPKPASPVIIGVYKLEDQTGQYKPAANGSTFSTAVPQGGTAILYKALDDSGYFTPIERESLSNLLQERQVITTTREQYARQTGQPQPVLPSLLYAGVLIEGGIVSYDTNVITGGAGAKYFGAGGSTQYRQDRITLYLRLVSVSNGQIIKTVYVSKTIFSQAVDASLFRYVEFKRLLEVETGFTTNEPVQLALAEAIEKAVEGLIIGGIEEGLWTPDASPEEIQELITTYKTELEEEQKIDVYERRIDEYRPANTIQVEGGGTLISGDYPDSAPEIMFGGGYRRSVTPNLGFAINYKKFNLKNEGILNEGFMTFDLNAEYMFLPYDKFTPYLVGGAGLHASNYFTSVAPEVHVGGGFEYMIDGNLGLKIFAQQTFVFDDTVDFLAQGKQDDQYLRFGIGLNFYFGGKVEKTTVEDVPIIINNDPDIDREEPVTPGIDDN